MGDSGLGRVVSVMFCSQQLIDYAKLGDTNERAMRMADFWLTVSAPCLLAAGEGILREPGAGQI